MIEGNTIGLATDGRTPMGNGGDGIELDDAPDTVIGGTALDQGNLIASNQGDGIHTSDGAAGLWVAGNWIGTDTTGALRLGNLGNGISLGSSSNTIGGTLGSAANVIEYNGTGRVGAGVELVGSVDHNLILSNSIYANAGLGINMGSGPTPNHAPGTPGPNDYQNYPVLSLAQSDGVPRPRSRGRSPRTRVLRISSSSSPARPKTRPDLVRERSCSAPRPPRPMPPGTPVSR